MGRERTHPKPQETTMSKNNYSDMLALLEYVDRKKEKKVGKIFGRRRRDDPEDITKQLVKYLESKEKFEKLIKSLEKKEEKKGLFPHWSTAKKTCFFALAGPPIGLMYAFIFITLVRQMALLIIH